MTRPASTSPPPAPLSALHGDTWDSPWWAVAIGAPKGQSETLADYIARLGAVDLSSYVVLAEARERPQPDTADPLFAWSLGDGVELGEATVTLPARAPDRPQPLEATLPALRLRLRVPDWIGKPTRWAGFLEVQLSSDGTADPDVRRTIQRRRRFEVAADLVT